MRLNVSDLFSRACAKTRRKCQKIARRKRMQSRGLDREVKRLPLSRDVKEIRKNPISKIGPACHYVHWYRVSSEVQDGN